jgi:hypothetical protein
MAITDITQEYNYLSNKSRENEVNLHHGTFSVVTPLRVLKTICKGFSYRSRVHSSCIKIELVRVNAELAVEILEYVKSHFFQYRFDMITKNLYFNENSNKEDF